MAVGVLFADEMTRCPIDTVANVVAICLLLNNSIFFLCASNPLAYSAKAEKTLDKNIRSESRIFVGLVVDQKSIDHHNF
jgi:hypothetical protein